MKLILMHANCNDVFPDITSVVAWRAETTVTVRTDRELQKAISSGSVPHGATNILKCALEYPVGAGLGDEFFNWFETRDA